MSQLHRRIPWYFVKPAPLTIAAASWMASSRIAAAAGLARKVLEDRSHRGIAHLPGAY
jgi:hypothetical protein